MDRLTYIHNGIQNIAAFEFFSQIGTDMMQELSDEEVANRINGQIYAKTQQKVQEFIKRCNENLSKLGNQVDSYKRDYNDAVDTANRADPGTFHKGYVDSSDMDSVNRHNRRVEEYNNRLDYHRRMVDKAERAGERYDDIIIKYNEKKQDLEEQIRAKKEELKPALDKDIVNFLGKMQQLVYDAIYNKNQIFEGFVFIFMAKKAYLFLYDRVEDSRERTALNDIFKKIEDELDKIAHNHAEEVKIGLIEMVSFVNQVLVGNLTILQQIKTTFSQIPYQDCSVHSPTIEEILAISTATTFDYKHIISPSELEKVSEKVHHLKTYLSTEQRQAHLSIEKINPIFVQILQIKQQISAFFQEMIQRKNTELGDKYAGFSFILGVFDEEIQDEYLRKQKAWLGEVEAEIEHELGLVLTQMVKEIVHTDIGILTAKQLIDENEGFSFANYQAKLQQKLQDFATADKQLLAILAEIDELPKQKAQAFYEMLKGKTSLTFVPILNILTSYQIGDEIEKFDAALVSKHSAYMELKEKISDSFQTQFTILAVISGILIMGSLIFAFIDEDKFAICIAVFAAGISYLASAMNLFALQKPIKSLQEHQVTYG